LSDIWYQFKRAWTIIWKIIYFPFYLFSIFERKLNEFRNTFFFWTWGFVERYIVSTIFLIWNFLMYLYYLFNWYFEIIQKQINSHFSNKFILFIFILISLWLTFYIFSLWFKKIKKIFRIYMNTIKLIWIFMLIFGTIIYWMYFFWYIDFNNISLQILWLLWLFWLLLFYVLYKTIFWNKITFN